MLKKMLKIQIIGLLLLSVNIQANSLINCNELTGCKKKICNLEIELNAAKKMNNISRIDGLETALEKVRKYCTDDKLIKDLEDKINDAKENLAEHSKDYEEAMNDNREDKIKKYKAKMQEDNVEIRQLQDELKGL